MRSGPLGGDSSVRWRTIAWTSAAGAVVGLVAWGLDLASATQLRFAGVADAEAQARVLEATTPSILRLEVRLALLHLSVGALIGLTTALAILAWPRLARCRPWVAAALGAGLTGLTLLLAVCGMVAHYPQLYAERWWLGGGARASLQYWITHRLGPRPFDALLLAVAAVVAVGALTTIARAVRRVPLRRLAAAAAVLLGSYGVGAWLGSGASAPPADAPNILILASDSLRTDRLESRAVMPFSASLVARGTLFRYAFTPIARTFPSWVSTLTGREPRETGVRTMFPSIAARRDVGATLFTELRDRGYATFVVSDFGGDVFPRFAGGFEVVDAPTATVDSLACASLLQAHGTALPALRFGWVRALFPEARAMASLADPHWLVDRAESRIVGARGRPFAGLVFFSTSHFPFVAPYPDYRQGAGAYRGRFLYHVPPSLDEAVLPAADVEQIRARYDGSLRAIDRATERLWRWLEERRLLEHTVVVVTGDHGEALFEEAGIFGHGDVIDGGHGQFAPVLLLGCGVRGGIVRNDQVRLLDLPATLLQLVDQRRGQTRFGDGFSLLAPDAPRPLCVETGIWFWPSRPPGLNGQRLEYPGIAELVTVDSPTRELVLKPELNVIVETAKERGLVLGNRLWRERLTPRGHRARLDVLPGVAAQFGDIDLPSLFEERCVAGDPHLVRLLDAIVYRAGADDGARAETRP
jgi:hypothetical protein